MTFVTINAFKSELVTSLSDPYDNILLVNKINFVETDKRRTTSCVHLESIFLALQIEYCVFYPFQQAILLVILTCLR